jgi:D-alanyl-D-alanine carboxypeptidase/D-alanyl-D-alanine-endopeptidase (penicillin-binding protein 4)
VAAALLLAGTAACATTGPMGPAPTPSSAAAHAIDSVLGSAPLHQVQWGVLAVEAGSRRTIHDHQGATKFIPASNIKVPLAAAALHHLGPDHRFVTALRVAGSFDPVTGTLTGDLVLPAAGDPTLSGRFRQADGGPLAALLESLRESGLRAVTGALVVDASAWDSASAVASWMVEDLPGIATGGAFVLEEGVTTVVIEAGARAGEPARVSWTPHGEDGFVVSRVRTVAAGAADVDGARPSATYHPESRRLVVEGLMVAGGVDTLRLGTRDPVRQSAAALARALVGAGIRLHGGWRVAWEPDEPLSGDCATGALDLCAAPTLARVASPPLTDVLAVTLGLSHNWLAEQLVRALGPYAPSPSTGAPGPTPSVPAGWPSGLSTLRHYLVETVGVDSLDLRLRDGSGLSAQNVLTPRALVQVLDHAQRAAWGESFRRALAEPGETNTTLSSRLEGLEGRLFAKTGTLTNVTTLSGYVLRPDGEVVLFSILTNASGLPASVVRTGIDRIVRALADG